MSKANAEYTIEVQSDHVILTDCGGPDVPTITNDAEAVLREVKALGYLTNGQRVFYYDSEGIVAELLHVDGEFAGFARAENGSARS